MALVRPVNRYWSALLGWVLLGACGQSPVFNVGQQFIAPVGESSSAIVGGTDSASGQDPEVFFLVIIVYANGQPRTVEVCSSTLIGPRTLLTAAHCIDVGTYRLQMPAANQLEVWAVSGEDFSAFISGGSLAADRDFLRSRGAIQATAVRPHEQWDGQKPGNGFDVGLVLLQQPASVKPKAWNTQPLTQGLGSPRAVGFGVSSLDSKAGVGTKRQIAVTLNPQPNNLLLLSSAAGTGFCNGDSGGPTFAIFADNVERVVGIHSYTAIARPDPPKPQLPVCAGYHLDTEVDAYGGFIQTWLEQYDNDCLKDGVCSDRACVSPDPDCALLGQACTQGSECASKICQSGDATGNAVAGGTYCTASCFQDNDCQSAGYVCSAGYCRPVSGSPPSPSPTQVAASSNPSASTSPPPKPPPFADSVSASNRTGGGGCNSSGRATSATFAEIFSLFCSARLAMRWRATVLRARPGQQR